MDINDLYRELGKSFTEEKKLTEDLDTAQRVFKDTVEEVNRQYREKTDAIHRRRQNTTLRVDELNEAIRLVEGGMDPVQAKLIAKETLADRLKEQSEEEEEGYLLGGKAIKGYATTAKQSASHASMSSLSARIRTEEVTRSSANTALSSRVSQLSSRLSGTDSSR